MLEEPGLVPPPDLIEVVQVAAGVLHAARHHHGALLGEHQALDELLGTGRVELRI